MSRVAAAAQPMGSLCLKLCPRTSGIRRIQRPYEMQRSTKAKEPCWPVQREHHQYMSMRAAQNRAKQPSAEAWMGALLRILTPYNWTPQAQWGFRLFDFWSHQIGTAVEVDGREHQAAIDAERDALELHRSAIIVLRVPNYDEDAARRVLMLISQSEDWNTRRARAGLKLIAGIDIVPQLAVLAAYQEAK
jgi:very-short-patch-repair endonuclease